jgi:peptidoglycan/xylan/chitin deacetylase (PgdA/CDA1 family)
MTNNYSIPVLMYHHVNPDGNFINVTPGVFEKHIRYLRDHGFNALNTADFLLILAGKQQPPKRPVMITFDDGWLDNWSYAFPVLRRYHMKAVIFVVTSLVAEQGRRDRSDEKTVLPLPVHNECQKMVEEDRAPEVMLSWDEMREMESSGLVDIQSHTHTHQRWDKMEYDGKARSETVFRELETSKKIIEDKLDKQCSTLCWPWGIYNDEYISLARSAGYKILFTTEKGTNSPETEQSKIRRITIGNIGPFAFRKKLFIHSRNWLSKAYLKYF